MLRYALYARKSDERKEVTEKSIGEQIAASQEMAKDSQLFIAATYEESQSAMTPNTRPIYSQMIRRIEKGEIDGILCWKVNRLVRNMEEGGKLAQLLIDGKIKEIRTPFGVHRSGDNILPLVIEAATSTQYSLDLVQNVKRGLKGHFESGGWNSKAHVGYVNARHPINQKIGIVVPDGERFVLLRKGWDMMLTGAYTPAQVAQYLNDVWGFRTRPTVKTGDKPLSRSCAYKVFRNPFYAGYVLYKGELKKAAHEPMVTDSEYAQVQEFIDRQSIYGGRRGEGLEDGPADLSAVVPTQKANRRSFAYTGLIRCGYCGLQITAEFHTMRNGKAYTFYRCSNARGDCTTKGMSERLLEARILDLLEGLTIDPELCDTAREEIIAHLESDTGEKQGMYLQQNAALSDVETQLSNLVGMWLRGILTDEGRYRQMEVELHEKKNRLLLASAHARDELEIMRANAVASCHYLKFARDCFLVADTARKREIAHALCLGYRMYGAERRLEVELNPLLVEVVRFAQNIPTPVQTVSPSLPPVHRHIVAPSTIPGTGIARERQEPAFEPHSIGSGSRKVTGFQSPILSGRGKGAELEIPSTLLELLRTSNFAHLNLG